MKREAVERVHARAASNLRLITLEDIGHRDDPDATVIVTMAGASAVVDALGVTPRPAPPEAFLDAFCVPRWALILLEAARATDRNGGDPWFMHAAGRCTSDPAYRAAMVSAWLLDGGRAVFAFIGAV